MKLVLVFGIALLTIMNVSARQNGPPSQGLIPPSDMPGGINRVERSASGPGRYGGKK